MAIIGVDVDLTVVASDVMWFDWCNSKCNHKYDRDRLIFEHGSIPYDFGRIFNFDQPCDPLSFWNDEGIYDELEPIAHAANALKELSRRHQIVFVSKLMGNHFESKKSFLERNFPFMSGFIGTDQKQFARVDLLIDDRVDHLNKVHQAGIIPIQYMTPYHQDEEPATDMAFIKSWLDLLCTNEDTLYNALLTNIRKAKV
jgi:5'(3')-deoxyribonucleotidase